MALINLIRADEATQEVADIYRQVSEQYGFVPNILRAMANCPDLLRTFVPFWAQVYSSPTIGSRLRAVAALGTAKAQNCSYCVAHMSASALRAGLEPLQIEAVGDRKAEQTCFDEREQLILELAKVITDDPDGTTSDLRNRLKATFTESEIVNIVLAIGTYNLTSRFLKTLQIDVEDVFHPILVADSKS